MQIGSRSMRVFWQRRAGGGDVADLTPLRFGRTNQQKQNIEISACEINLFSTAQYSAIVVVNLKGCQLETR